MVAATPAPTAQKVRDRRRLVAAASAARLSGRDEMMKSSNGDRGPENQGHARQPTSLGKTHLRPLVTPQVKKQKAGEGINSRIQLVVKSGKFTLGYKTVLKQLRSGKCAPRSKRAPRRPRRALCAVCLLGKPSPRSPAPPA